MLDKSICQTCVEMARRKSSPFHEGWTKQDNERWEKQFVVMCMATSTWVGIHEGVPEGCMYVLDQMMMNDDDECHQTGH